MRKNKFKECLPKNRVYVKYFSGANTNQLNYYLVFVLIDEKPNNICNPYWIQRYKEI